QGDIGTGPVHAHQQVADRGVGGAGEGKGMRAVGDHGAVGRRRLRQEPVQDHLTTGGDQHTPERATDVNRHTEHLGDGIAVRGRDAVDPFGGERATQVRPPAEHSVVAVVRAGRRVEDHGQHRRIGRQWWDENVHGRPSLPDRVLGPYQPAAASRTALPETAAWTPADQALFSRGVRLLRGASRGTSVGFTFSSTTSRVITTLAMSSRLGTSNITGCSTSSMIARSPRAPVPRKMAWSATASTASSLNSSSTPSISNIRWYCLISAFFGSVRMRTSAGPSNGETVVSTGSRP